MRAIALRLSAILVIIIVSAFGAIAALAAYDFFLGFGIPVSGHALRPPKMATLELYPFTGFHMPAHLHHTELGQDIHSGDMGFWSPDFDFKSPPTKVANEIRIIVIGGSGAQGQAPDAIRDDLTIRRQLQEKLQLLLPNKLVRVVSMAMGGSTTYQNFIALNLWGHAIKPDMIVSYSGFNEWHVPLTYERAPESYYGFTEVSALTLADQKDNWPPALGWLPRWFPNIAYLSPISTPLKLLFFKSYYEQRARERFKNNLRLNFKNDADMIEHGVLPFYISALKSIKRDFDGIPIAVVWQCLDRTSFDWFTKDSDHSFTFKMYDEQFSRVTSELTGYRNSKWIFWNAQNEIGGKNIGYTFHLSVEAQADVAVRIAKKIAPSFQ